MRSVRFVLFVLLVALSTSWAQNTGQATNPAAPDLTKEPTLYVVPYAHLDTQWRWDYVTTISEYLPSTMHDNFALFEKYPHYVFNFSGANRYRMMKEYYPADYEKLKQYVAAGRWFPSGSSMEENDVNSPSAESIIRQILYGTHYFRREFGKTSAEFMLPDCFGFPASLPSILAHMGLKGFSTQKLSWRSGARVGGAGSPQDTPEGIPFNVGYWVGLDGKGVVAALNAMDYSGDIRYDLTKSPFANPGARNQLTDWPKRIQKNGEHGLFVDYSYYGTGDIGGSPREASVKLMEAIVTKRTAQVPPPNERRGFVRASENATVAPEITVGDGPLHVVQATAEQMFLDIKPEQIARLPRYEGDLELIEHSAGSLTSEAYMKRWNRKNEVLADDAERASVAAAWLGGRAYPQQRLNNAWTLVMGGQFHDIIPGTSLPKAYEYAWNDQVLALNQFGGVLTSATESIASGMNTQANGTPILVYNPLNIAREDVVEAAVAFTTAPKAVRVLGPDGKEVPAQFENGKVVFLAKVPSVGFAVFDVQPAEAAASSTLKVTENSLENARYRIQVNGEGDVASIFDKTLNRELLAAPARLAFKTDKPQQWPAWNMDWADQQKPPRSYVAGPTKFRIVENGPARVALEIAREAENSKFVQTIRLSAGDAGNRIEFGNAIDWKTSESNLKAVFPLTASNAVATYNWDIGTIQRANDDDHKFEVASHQWFDLTDKTGAFGVTVLTDAKNGSDKPNDNTLALTLLRSPGTFGAYPDQTTQDWGHHEFIYGLAAHAGDWRAAQTDWQAERLNQPLVAFETNKHAGALGKSFSLMNVSNTRVRVLALKKAEDTDEFIVRLVELDGRPQHDVRIAFSAPITAAREVNGQELPVGAANVVKGELVTDVGPYQPRTFAIKLATSKAKLVTAHSQPVTLDYDRAVASNDGTKSVGGFDASGQAIPAEMLPTELAYDGIQFKLAGAKTGANNAIVAKGQTINLPVGKFTRVYVLAAAEDDQPTTFRVGDKAVDVTVQNWGGYIGQWDNRIWKKIQLPPPTQEEVERANQRYAAAEAARRAAGEPSQPRRERPRTAEVYDGLVPGFVKPASVAWFASHRHTADGVNEPYAYSYLFAYAIDLPAGAKTLNLPNNDKVRILAITVSDETASVHAAQPLYDTLTHPAAGGNVTTSAKQ